ncbi:DUF5067 domain-containing protein [Holzapfeliella sp. He02]|uniref:DUF5067 domain-containing protein n=1 Tax=Holzapfeliella saturejae TaxID=3082953 RepID=A0ABU8SHT3_9LACO
MKKYLITIMMVCLSLMISGCCSNNQLTRQQELKSVSPTPAVDETTFRSYTANSKVLTAKFAKFRIDESVNNDVPPIMKVWVNLTNKTTQPISVNELWHNYFSINQYDFDSQLKDVNESIIFVKDDQQTLNPGKTAECVLQFDLYTNFYRVRLNFTPEPNGTTFTESINIMP